MEKMSPTGQITNAEIFELNFQMRDHIDHCSGLRMLGSDGEGANFKQRQKFINPGERIVHVIQKLGVADSAFCGLPTKKLMSLICNY